jgi:hypothetical protein
LSRLHPFDLAGAPLVSAFTSIRARCPDAPDFATFCKIPEARDLLHQLAGLNIGEGDPRAAEHYMYLLFAVYRFWYGGQQTLSVVRERLQDRLGAEPRGMPSVPGGACYVTLPVLWFWARIDPETPPEPLDGMFVVADRDPSRITVVVVLGIRPERSGFSLIVGGGDENLMLAAVDRVRRPAFEPDFDGGEAAGFRSCTSEAELLYLTRLALHAAAE